MTSFQDPSANLPAPQSERLLGIMWPELSPALIVQKAVDRGLLTNEQGKRACSAHQRANGSIIQTLLELGLVDEEPLYEILSQASGIGLFDPATDWPKPVKFDIALDFFRRMGIAPIEHTSKGVAFAFSEFSAREALEATAYKLRTQITPVLAPPSAISALLEAYEFENSLLDNAASDDDLARLTAAASNGPVVKAVNDLIGKAVGAEASDIHIEADENGSEVRFRINGEMAVISRFTNSMAAAVVSRLKIMSGLNISEKRRPQDGRASLVVRGRPIDIRLSTLPAIHGESLVLRLLDQRQLRLSWQDLGYDTNRIEEIRRLIGRPDGIFLIAGPTGSGKTTTLYTALAELNESERKIITIEDPIEYRLPGIVQVQVEAEIDMTFASALRAILRQDPNVIMVGEIRDQETAEIAVRAAQMGRLVLSTIHTNDAIGGLDRLLDLGVPPYLLATALRGVLAQRLVKKRCPDCAGDVCLHCGGNRYLGRTVVSELFVVDTDIQNALSRGETGVEIRKIKYARGYQDLATEANELINNNIISSKDWSRAFGT